MRDSDNIQELVKLSPDYIGFIFYDKSKRFVSEFPKVEIPSRIKKVGVFVNESIANIVDLVVKNKLDAVQLHGGESAEYCDKLRSQHDVTIIKAFSVDEHFDFSITKSYEKYCDLFIFDTKGIGYGGTGLKYDWNILGKYKGETPFLLSGGIGVDDVESVESFFQGKGSNQCVGVDLNSGFEDEPAVKNIGKLKEFIKKVN